MNVTGFYLVLYFPMEQVANDFFKTDIEIISLNIFTTRYPL